MKEYLKSIRHQVCPACRHGVTGENFFLCGLSKNKKCMIKRFLPEVVEIVELMKGPVTEHHLVMLRKKVCHECDQFKYGSCPLTGIGDCTLDSYFPQVVEAIKEVKTQLR